MHLRGGLSPAGPSPPVSSHDQAPRFRLELNLFGQLRLLEERFGNANAPRIADPHDA
jgi:hypothetical protein